MCEGRGCPKNAYSSVLVGICWGRGDFLVYSSINSFTQNKVCVCTMFSGLTPQDKTADQRRDISHPFFFLMALALPGVQPDEIRIKKKPLSLEVT